MKNQELYKNLQSSQQSSVINLEKGKIPPQAVDLEEVVLGAMMIDKKGVDEVIDILSIDFKGNIRLGGACKMKLKDVTDKTIYDDYVFPNSPQVCAIDICKCSPDVETRKFKNG